MVLLFDGLLTFTPLELALFGLEYPVLLVSVVPVPTLFTRDVPVFEFETLVELVPVSGRLKVEELPTVVEVVFTLDVPVLLLPELITLELTLPVELL